MVSSPARSPRVVIIGLGVVGAALADELTSRGLTDVTVFDQGPLYITGGSSSHAPGFVFQTNGDRTMTHLAQRTLDKLDGISLNGQWLLKRVGGLEIATTEERFHDLKRRRGLAASWGVPGELIDPDEVARLWPGLDVSGVLGGYLTPTDGIVKSAVAVQWQAERAQDRGARIVGNTRVVGIERSGGRVTGVKVVPVPAGSAEPDFVAADIVISCAGLWGPGVARDLLGFELPMQPMEHGFGYSAPVPSLQGANVPTDEAKRPMLRHQDFSLYLREYVDRIGIGAYNHRPIPLEQSEIADADTFAATGVHPAMHPLTWDDFAPSWEEAQRLLPELRGVEFESGYNGIFSFTPDGGPMLGPVPGTDGLWLAQAVWVTQSAGVAQVVADWIVSGDPGIDTHGLDFNRFDPAVVSRRFTRERSSESYDEVYDVRHPHTPTQRLRGLRRTPFHQRYEELGAVFGEGGGWERPLWFEANAGLVDELETVPVRDDWAAQNWSPIAAAEAHATRSAVALYDLTALPRVEIFGPGTTALLQRLLTTNVDVAIGRVVYGMMLDEQGGILSDVTVTRLDTERYMIGTNGNLDLVHLTTQAPEGVWVRSLSSGQGGLGLWGPNARAVLESLTHDDVSHEGFGFFRAKQIDIAGVSVLALRVSYVGELGWELYVSADNAVFLWDALWEAGQAHGIIAAGRRAFNALRLEKGYRAFGHDMTREHSPAEAGLSFAVRMAKDDFLGKAALAERPVTTRLVPLTLDDPARVVLGAEPVFVPGTADAVGYVTSADQGYTIGASIAYAWLPPELADPGTTLEIEYFAERLPATVRTEPLFDPEMAAIRR